MTIQEIMEQLAKRQMMTLNSAPLSTMTSEERIAELNRREVERHNQRDGNLNEKDGINCTDCKNKGDIAFVKDEYVMYKQCHCMELRNSIYVLEHSGISKQMLDKYTFEKYQTPTQWQKDLKNKSLAYVAENLENQGTWLYMGGQSGAGKTHLCTSICQRLAKKYTVRYELWSRIAGLIKSRAMEQDEKDKLLYELAQPEVMYIDDLLKGTTKVTDGDIKALFDVINIRYLNPKLITIISSELTLEDLRRIDEAIAGRIAERAGNYTLALPKNSKFNYRFKEAQG